MVALSELYEKTKRDEDLAELLSAQISGAQERGDVQGELSFQVRLGEVYDSRLADRERAIETYRAVLARDATHSGALEALARLLQSENRLAEAAQVLDRLLSASSGEAAVARALELAAVQLKLGSPDEAAIALERGLSQDEQSAELRSRLRSLYESTKAWDKLAALLTRDADFAQNAEESVALLRKAATIFAEQRGDHGSAADALDRASKLRPDESRAPARAVRRIQRIGPRQGRSRRAAQDRGELRLEAARKSSGRSTGGWPRPIWPTARTRRPWTSSTRPSASSPAT